jgi:hypothetical protein
MPIPAALHSAEARAVADFLAAASIAPTALVIEGEVGIGKTTLWLAAIDQARERGFRVLSARTAQTESVRAYTSAADLLADVDEIFWGDLPSPQRDALDRMLLRSDGRSTNQRTLAAGLLSLVNRIAAESPTLLAIDDLQWLDTSSRNALAYVARRLSTRVGVLGTLRTDKTSSTGASWLQMPRPDAITRLGLQPLSLGRVQTLVSERLGQTFSRPTMICIQEISGGNPFYALELARVISDQGAAAELPLPSTLAELVQARIGSIDPAVQDALLATACVAAPTVEVVGRAIDADSHRAAELLEKAEDNGIVTLVGHRVRFVHPLLAHGVYTNVPAAQRRRMHRRLAAIFDEPELHARHLALATTSGDRATLQSLDAGAEAARLRGAPAAAVELLELAFGLGGDTPERRIRLALYHFSAGHPGRARALLEETIRDLSPGHLRADAVSLLAVMGLLNGIFSETASLLKQALNESGEDHSRRAQVLIALSFARLNFGQLESAARSVEDAVATATRLDQPHLLSQALGIRALVRCMRGGGLDETDLHRAVELEGRHPDIPAAFRPRLQNAILRGWAGDLTLAHEECNLSGVTTSSAVRTTN